MRTSLLVALNFAFLLTASTPATAQEVGGDRVARFVQVDSLEGFAGFFNIAQGTVRIVSFLSPTCPSCVNGFYEIKRIMEDVPSNRLRSFVVFMPVLDRDKKSLALTLLANYHNKRASYFWDPNFKIAEAFAPLAGSPTPVVDGYFLFDTRAVVRDVPDAPTLWVRTHEHETKEAPGLDGAALEGAVRDLLDRFEKREQPGDRDERE